MERASDKPTVLKATQVALDNYDDIFSDFDISPYSKRLLSYDFLKELKRRSAETKTGELRVSFTLPKAERSSKTESLIKKRLKGHFRNHLKKVDKKINDSRKKGIVKIFVGLMASVLIFTFTFQAEMPITTMMSVLAWYFMWAGYTDVFESADKLGGEREFYEKYLNAKYEFYDEEDLVAPLRGPAISGSVKRKESS